MKRKFAITVICFMLTASFLTGCGQKGENEKTVVTVIHSAKMENIEALVEEEYPDIDLQWERVISPSPNSDMRRRLDSGKGPDLVVSAQPADEDSSKYVLPLSGYAFSTEYESTLINSMSVDDMVYYLPFPSQYNGYVINKTLFDEAGLSIPENNEELIEDLTIMKQKKIGITDTGHVFGLRQKDDVTLGNFLVACMVPDFLGTTEGVEWMTDFNENKAVMEGTWEPAFDLLEELVEKDLMNITTYTKEGNAPDNQHYMSEGDLAVLYGTSATLEECRQLNEKKVKAGETEKYTYSMLPFMGEGDAPRWTIALPSAYIGINADLEDDAEKLDACCRILELMSTQEGQEALMKDTGTDNSYLKDFSNEATVPSGLEEVIEDGYIYNVKFPGKIIEYLGQQGSLYLSGTKTVEEALAAVDAYHKEGSEAVDEDLSVVGSVAEDLVLQNYDARLKETALGNLVADSIADFADAPIAVANGGGIRASLYQGDVRYADLKAVCPFDNQIITVKMKGSVLYQMLEHGLSELKTSEDIPGGRFLQVSGICYKFDSSKPKGDRLESVTLDDGTAIESSKTYTVAINNYMAGKNGYLEGNGDGYTMLNLYSDEVDKAKGVSMAKKDIGTYAEALKAYFEQHENKPVHKKVEGRIKDIAK